MLNIITVFLAFLLSLLLSMFLTPVAMRVGKRWGAVDRPDSRKVHVGLIPRTGGLAIVTTFFLVQLLFLYTEENIGHFFVNWKVIQTFWLGALFAAGVGVIDDFKRLPSILKLLVQILAAVIVFTGGIRIDFASLGLQFSFLPSCLLTVFWFVLLINAINLIDGLDGLAAGVVMFSSAVMSMMMIIGGNGKVAIIFALLTGTMVGFLRYNFNPAKVFMGDGGSYFLGYTLAFLSIHYVAKSQMSLSLFIPIIALGVPIFDVIISPIRRFIIGQKIFQADKGHIHHRLLAMGLTTRRAVLLLYCASSALALSALFLVNLDSRKSGVIFVILGVAAILFIRKLGYFEYLAFEKIFGWLHDIEDVAGLTRDRRAFWGVEINIRESKTFHEMWNNVCLALDLEGFQKRWLHLYNEGAEDLSGNPCDESGSTNDGGIKTTAYWFKGHDAKKCRPQEDVPGEWKFEMKVPLVSGKGHPMGVLYLVRDLRENPLSPHTVRRVESLCRSMCVAIEKLQNGREVPKGRVEAAVKKKRVGAFLTRFLS